MSCVGCAVKELQFFVHFLILLLSFLTLFSFAEGCELASRRSKNIQCVTDSCRNALETFNAAAAPETQLVKDHQSALIGSM